MAKIDPAQIEQLKSRVPISQLVGNYVAADKHKSKPGDLWACCPVHSEDTPSFHAEDSRGHWHCFGCGATGDHFDFLTQVQGKTFPEAVEIMSGWAGMAVEPIERPKRAPAVTYTPVPDDAPPIVAGKRTPPLARPGKEPISYTPAAVYPYHDERGRLMGYVLRVEGRDGKKVTPAIWWSDGWTHGTGPSPRPLYGLPDLLKHPERQVLVVEGEKCRDAAAAALGGSVVVVSWLGGTQAVDKTDWTPLHGRSVILWPDNDAGGAKAMAGGEWGQNGHARWKDGVLQRAKPARAKWVAPYGSEGGDVADLIEDGGDVAAYIRENIGPVPTEGDGDDEKSDPFRMHTRLDHRGITGDEASDRTTYGPSSAHRDSGTGEVDELTRTVFDEANSGDGTATDSVGMDRNNGDKADQGLAEQPRDAPDAIGSTALTLTPDPGWESGLLYTDDGGMRPNSLHNAMLLLQCSTPLSGLFQFNDFAKAVYVIRCPPWESYWNGERMMKDTDVTACVGYLETMGLRMKRNDLGAAIERVAEYNRVNPVLSALEALEWDGVPRIVGGNHGDRTFAPFGVRYFGSDNTEINNAFFTRTLIGAVARAYEPGCKLDTVLILEGAQGLGKSSAVKALCDGLVEGMFSDQIDDPGSKDAGLQMQGKWIIELSELDAFSKAEAKTIKAWLSRATDNFRRPYGKITESFMRSCIFIGSINPPTSGYLRDPTGARRFWPVAVGEVDLPLIRDDARQIWAEAVALYKSGEQWWLTKEEEDMQKVVTEARMENDPWQALIKSYLESPAMAMTNQVRVVDVMGEKCLRIPAERQSAYLMARVEALLTLLRWRLVERGVYERGA